MKARERSERAAPERWIGRFGRQRAKLLASILSGIDRYAGTRQVAKAPLRCVPEQVKRTRFAVVGCGFVADSYGRTLSLHPELELVGVTDLDSSRAAKFASIHGTKVYRNLEALLQDDRVEIVVNLTNPSSHFAVTKWSLEAGKHVYSEKPLAMVLTEAEELVSFAKVRGLLLSSAPCSILGESAQALGKALRENKIGEVRLAYAELDDGPIHQMHPEEWASLHGTPWPWRDEFSVGCTMEHAGYHLSWLVAFFGPAESVTAFSSSVIPHKHPDLAPEATAPDFSVAVIRFHSGVIARLTCSIVAAHDHSLRIIGDKGVLSVDECWHFGTPVRLRRFTPLGFRAESHPWVRRNWLTQRIYGLNSRPLTNPKPGWRRRLKRHEMDYLLGVKELASALREKRPSRLSAQLALHVNEIALAIHHAGTTGSSVSIRSRVVPSHHLECHEAYC